MERIFQEILNTEQMIDLKEVNDNKDMEKYKRFQSYHKINAEEVLKDVVKMLNSCKQQGTMGLCQKWRSAQELSLEMLKDLFYKAWQIGTIQKDWELGIQLLIVKKKRVGRDCTGYREITGLSIISEIYEQILEKRLREQVEELLKKFRKVRGILKTSLISLSFMIKQLTE